MTPSTIPFPFAAMGIPAGPKDNVRVMRVAVEGFHFKGFEGILPLVWGQISYPRERSFIGLAFEPQTLICSPEKVPIMPSRTLTSKKKSVVKKKAPSKKKVSSNVPAVPSSSFSFQKVLSRASASVSLSAFKTIYNAPLTVHVRVENEKIIDAAFECAAPQELVRALDAIANEMVGKKPHDAESISLKDCMLALSPQTNLEREYVQYAYTAWMDVLSKVQLDDPLSKALGKLEKINKEFPDGTMVPDFGD